MYYIMNSNGELSKPFKTKFQAHSYIENTYPVNEWKYYDVLSEEFIKDLIYLGERRKIAKTNKRKRR